MDLDSVPGRISLGVITMLAVSGQAGVGKTFKFISKKIYLFEYLRASTNEVLLFLL
jgi:hypothetical protein